MIKCSVKNILLIDDDGDDQLLFIDAIKSIDVNINCKTANDGESAFKMLYIAPSIPDLIFLDLNMPRMSGKQFLSRIKKIPRLKDIPVIIYTTSHQEIDEIETKKLGALYFLSKPYTFDEICEELEGLFIKKGLLNFHN
jgi:CheY-like chemotaxis protein